MAAGQRQSCRIGPAPAQLLLARVPGSRSLRSLRRGRPRGFGAAHASGPFPAPSTMLEPEPEAQQPALPAEDDSGLDGAGGSFAAGSSVALRGLQSQPELNGRIGVVRGFSQEKGRYTVEVDGRERAVRLKPSNVYIPTVPGDRTGTSAAGFFDIAPFMMPEDESDGTECAAERRLLAASWDATFRSVGFARIVGHGVSPTLISELRAAAGEFFARPEPDKMVYHRPAQPGRPLTGSFNPMFGCRAAAGGHDDPVEGYTFYRQYDGWRLSDPALAHPPELAAVAERYVEEVERVMHALHRLSAASLGLEPTFFDSAPDTKMSSLLVISHYPPTSGLEVDVADGQPRYRAHSDYTGFTILLQDEGDHEQVSEGAGDADADAARQGSAGGLEIDLDGQWTPVIPRAGSFVRRTAPHHAPLRCAASRP